MTDLPKELNISYDKDSIIIWLNGLENDEYVFCWGLDFLKSQKSFKLDKSQGNGLGLGCGVQNFSFDGIHCEFEYDEMVGLWIETKDANEGSPEEIKQKIISFGQRIFDELIRKENEQKLRGF